MSGISEETKAKIKLWDPRDASTWPEWYRWDGGWYESNGELTRYCVWDNLGNDAIVFDVGAYEGEWTRRMACKYPDYRIYAFEPAPRAFGIARERLAQFAKVSLYNFGLGSECGTFPLYDSQRDAATFVGGKGAATEAEMMSITKFLDVKEIDKIALMSVNIEGGEFELLPYMIGARLVERVERFMIQWHSIFANAFEMQTTIQSALARTHKMIWNHGAWEAWLIKQ